MTTLYLIRHAHCDHVGQRVVGRLPGIRLSAQGEREACELADRLASVDFAEIYSSPLERAMQTAELLARPRGLTVTTEPGLIELDYGDWTGLTLDEVRARPEWAGYTAARSRSVVPNGEGLAAVQARAVEAVVGIAARHPRETVAAVSHGDVIRAIVAEVACIPLDAIDRFELPPASVTVIEMGDGWRRLRALNAYPPRISSSVA